MLFTPIHSEKRHKGAVAVSYTMEKTGNVYPLKEKHTLKKNNKNKKKRNKSHDTWQNKQPSFAASEFCLFNC